MSENSATMFSMLSERGFKLLVFEGFKFSKNRRTLCGQKWRCTNRKCSAHLFTDDNGDELFKAVGVHNHEPCPNLHRHCISNSVKRKATETLTEPPAKVIKKEIVSVPENISGKVTTDDMDRIRRNLNYAKRSKVPPLPRCIADVHDALDSIPIKTTQGEEMLLLNLRAENIVVFCSKRNLEYLANIDNIFMDGTFTYAPKYFYQFFTIHGVNNGNYVPLIFCLLPNKTEETYISLFDHLKVKCEEYDILFNPKQITVDFEIAIQNAVRSSWPLAKLRGCRFHLSQAWWRKIQHLGLSNEYKSETSEAGKWLHWIFGLSLLDAGEVEDAFVEDLMSIQPPNVEDFSNYLVENYIDSSSPFPPSLWASSSTSSERTTNACESFHAKFGRHFYHPHPNIFVFIEAMKSVQIDTYIGIRSSTTPRKITNGRYKKRLQFLENLHKKYTAKQISRLHFIKSVCYQYKK